MPPTRPPRQEAPPQELNLAPIMNMVIILIPMLLLSVVFMEVSVIEISSPSLCSASCGDTTHRKPLNLSVHVTTRGFEITAYGERLPPEPGCDPQGREAVCLRDGQDARADIDAARGLLARGEREAGERALAEVTRRYDWRRLYNVISRLEAAHELDAPPAHREHKLSLSAASQVPFVMLVRVMDVTRYRLSKPRYETDEAFWGASTLDEPLLPIVSLAVVR